MNDKPHPLSAFLRRFMGTESGVSPVRTSSEPHRTTGKATLFPELNGPGAPITPLSRKSLRLQQAVAAMREDEQYWRGFDENQRDAFTQNFMEGRTSVEEFAATFGDRAGEVAAKAEEYRQLPKVAPTGAPVGKPRESSKLWTRTTQRRTWIPQAVASLMLLWALYPENPYAYYVLLRWVCCGIFAFLAYKVYEATSLRTNFDRRPQAWIWILGITAGVYNPILTVHLTRGIWSIVNVVTIVIAVASIFGMPPHREDE